MYGVNVNRICLMAGNVGQLVSRKGGSLRGNRWPQRGAFEKRSTYDKKMEISIKTI